MSVSDEPLLIIKNISKVYPNGVVANKQINLSIEKGSVHVILGENGAGKTTLMNILFGMVQPDSGIIRYMGKNRRFNSTADAIDTGIGMIHQHFKLVPSLSILENCFLGIEPKRLFFTDYKKMKDQMDKFLTQYDMSLPPYISAGDCSTSQRQMIEIIKTLIRGANLIIMDEPTALLTPQERDSLFNIIGKLKNDGKTIILITHKINEAMLIGDFVTIMSEGEVLRTYDQAVSSLKTDDLLKMLFKDGFNNLNPTVQTPSSDSKALSFQKVNLNKQNKTNLYDLSFTVKKGEILGFAGMPDSGQRDIINIVTGYEPSFTGVFKIQGEPVGHYSPVKAREQKVSYIPSDRLNLGSDKELSLWENLFSTQIDSTWMGSPFKLRKRKINDYADNLMRSFRIKAQNPGVKLTVLSGGNIQKTILARELSQTSEIIVADNPTRGIDPRAASFIRKRLYLEKNNGKAILLFSNDLDELMDLSDRIIVLYEGRIIKEFAQVDSLNEYRLGACMLGKKGSMVS